MEKYFTYSFGRENTNLQFAYSDSFPISLISKESEAATYTLFQSKLSDQKQIHLCK